MSELCTQCRHRRLPDASAESNLNASGASASVQAVLTRLRNQLAVDRNKEDMAFRSEGRGAAILERRPFRHEWCARQSTTDAGRYYFCDWLKAPKCELYEARDGSLMPKAAADATATPARQPTR